MISCVNDYVLVDLEKHFKFNEDVCFGSVSFGGSRSLDKFFCSYHKDEALEDGFYILGIASNDSQGYCPIISVNTKEKHSVDNWSEDVYVVGELKNGIMRDVITNEEIKYVDNVDVIHFCAPHALIRYSNNVWQEYPEVDGKEFEPRYYYSDLCYVTCNKIEKLDVLKYLEYFMMSPSAFFDNYCKKLNLVKEEIKSDYNKILDAYNNELCNKYDNVVKIRK